MLIFNKGRQKSFRTKVGLLAIPPGQSEQPDAPELIRCVTSNSDLSLFEPEAKVKEEAPKKKKEKGKKKKGQEQKVEPKKPEVKKEFKKDTEESKEEN